MDVIAETSGKRTTGHLAAVHVVTEDEAAAGVSSIDDVVLPLPGPMISYPEHSTAQVPLASALPCIRFVCVKIDTGSHDLDSPSGSCQ